MANIAETERKAVVMADGILAAVNENGNIDRFIDTKGGVHYIEPKRYEESVAKIDAAATKAKETVNSATEAVSECKAQTGACTQETARAKEIADTVESRITGIEGDVAALRDSVYQDTGKVYLYNEQAWGSISYRAKGGVCTLVIAGIGGIAANGSWTVPDTIPRKFMPDENAYAPLCHRQTDHQAQIWIPSKHYENSNLIIYSAIDTYGTSNRISGILSWVY